MSGSQNVTSPKGVCRIVDRTPSQGWKTTVPSTADSLDLMKCYQISWQQKTLTGATTTSLPASKLKAQLDELHIFFFMTRRSYSISWAAYLLRDPNLRTTGRSRRHTRVASHLYVPCFALSKGQCRKCVSWTTKKKYIEKVVPFEMAKQMTAIITLTFQNKLKWVMTLLRKQSGAPATPTLPPLSGSFTESSPFVEMQRKREEVAFLQWSESLASTGGMCP